MTAVAAPPALNWERIAKASMHPVAVQILRILSGAELAAGDPARTPSDLADAIGYPLGTVAYHVRMLRQRGLIVETRTVAVRGALAHYYRLANGVAR